MPRPDDDEVALIAVLSAALYCARLWRERGARPSTKWVVKLLKRIDFGKTGPTRSELINIIKDLHDGGPVQEQ